MLEMDQNCEQQKQFEETYENPQWGKAKQMQPI